MQTSSVPPTPLKSRLCFAAALLIILCSCSGGGGSSGDNSSTPPAVSATCEDVGASPWVLNSTPCRSAHAAIVQLKISGLTENAVCSATLISSTAAITAAHCFTTFAVAHSEILANGIEVAVSRVVLHPQAQKTAREYLNDVAIVHLASPVEAAQMPLLTSRQVTSGEMVSIFGYGIDDQGQQGILHGGNMRITSVTSTHLSAFYDGSGSNACFGDSGGAVLSSASVDGLPIFGIAGVISSGSNGTCANNDLNLFANLQTDAMIQFILNEVPNVGIV